jgi:hypothetical protein
VKIFLQGTLLSILVFCTTSFATVLLHISHLLAGREGPLHIGFPFTYFTQGQHTSVPAVSWAADYLVYDCLLAWILIVGACFLLQYKKPDWYEK